MHLLRPILFLTFFCGHGFSQQRTITVQTRITEVGEGTKNACVNIYRADTLFMRTGPTGKNGSLRFDLPMGEYEYLLEFSKEGDLSKKVILDTRTVPSAHTHCKVTCIEEVALFKMPADTAAANKVVPFLKSTPVGLVRYFSLIDKFDVDPDYTDSVRQIMPQLKPETRCIIEPDYQTFISAADALSAQGKYTDALYMYKKAQMADPNQQYPKDKIQLIEQLIKSK